MKLKTPKILMLLMTLTMQFAFSQTKTINGIVSDDSGPIPGATVMIKNSPTATLTDFDGIYNIDAKEGDILEFSYVGMETLEQVVGTNSTINVTLKAIDC